MSRRALLERLRPQGLPVWLAAVLASLLLGTWLTAAHPIVHLHPEAGHAHDTASLKNLFGPHGSTADCLVFDHLHLGDALPAQAAPVLHPAPAAPQHWAVSSPRGHALVLAFLARGPPPIRSLA